MCENGGKCDHVSGACMCTAGWRSMHCSKPCPNGFFGQDCRGVCSCENSAKCDHITGDCTCAPGWIGEGNVFKFYYMCLDNFSLCKL